MNLVIQHFYLTFFGDTDEFLLQNLQDLDFEGALEVARSTVEGLPASQLLGFENVVQNITNALGLSAPMFQIAATAEDPLFPFNTPTANSQLDCVSALAAGANAGNTVMSCSEHTYQYSVCDPPRVAVATLSNLPRIHAVREQLGPDSFVIARYDTLCSFPQCLKGGPLALQSSVQLNHGGLSLYDLWYPVENQNGPVKVFPSYASYLFVAEALGHSKAMRIANIYPGRQANGSTITTGGGDSSAGQLVAGPVTVRRLQALGADIKDANVTVWAGQTFESGLAKGRLREERITGGKIVVPASEAVLVTL
ncbi:glycoside hydrolase family protein [Salix suchowensis]|nr:glycoside hydrolase family protein [Salix suchowensis]